MIFVQAMEKIIRARDFSYRPPPPPPNETRPVRSWQYKASPDETELNIDEIANMGGGGGRHIFIYMSHYKSIKKKYS